MKLFLALPATTTLLGACKNDRMSTNTYTKKEEDKRVTANVYASHVITNTDDVDIKIEKLRKLKPMSSHEAAVLLPRESNDFELENPPGLYAYTIDNTDTMR